MAGITQSTRSEFERETEQALRAAGLTLEAAMDALELARKAAHGASLVGVDEERRISRIVRSVLVTAQANVWAAQEHVRVAREVGL